MDTAGEKKVEVLLSPNDPPETCATFVIWHEDHTLGNVLRHVILKNPNVEFCGYTMPHPSEPKLHLRIQTKPDTQTPTEALNTGLENLMQLTDHVSQTFDDAWKEFNDV
eukprot:Clim_evm11s9 gene=Clim_evmTU11s9